MVTFWLLPWKSPYWPLAPNPFFSQTSMVGPLRAKGLPTVRVRSWEVPDAKTAAVQWSPQRVELKTCGRVWARPHRPPLCAAPSLLGNVMTIFCSLGINLRWSWPQMCSSFRYKGWDPWGKSLGRVMVRSLELLGPEMTPFKGSPWRDECQVLLACGIPLAFGSRLEFCHWIPFCNSLLTLEMSWPSPVFLVA